MFAWIIRRKGRLTAVATGLVIVIILSGSIDMGRNTELQHSIHVAAQPNAVWAVLADLEAVQHYNPTIDKAVYLSGPREGVGAARECSVAEGLLRERVTGWVEGKAIKMELYESPWPIRVMEWETRLNPSNGGTMVTQSLHYRLKFGLIGALLNTLVMRKKINQTLNEVFVEMKRYIEKKAG